jgi:hypothetical protein
MNQELLIETMEKIGSANVVRLQVLWTSIVLATEEIRKTREMSQGETMVVELLGDAIRSRMGKLKENPKAPPTRFYIFQPPSTN